MAENNTNYIGYTLAAILGAFGGGMLVVLATRAFPKMMSGMMQNMMSRMGDDGPPEF